MYLPRILALHQAYMQRVWVGGHYVNKRTPRRKLTLKWRVGAKYIVGTWYILYGTDTHAHVHEHYNIRVYPASQHIPSFASINFVPTILRGQQLIKLSHIVHLTLLISYVNTLGVSTAWLGVGVAGGMLRSGDAHPICWEGWWVELYLIKLLQTAPCSTLQSLAILQKRSKTS